MTSPFSHPLLTLVSRNEKNNLLQEDTGKIYFVPLVPTFGKGLLGSLWHFMDELALQLYQLPVTFIVRQECYRGDKDAVVCQIYGKDLSALCGLREV